MFHCRLSVILETNRFVWFENDWFQWRDRPTNLHGIIEFIVLPIYVWVQLEFDLVRAHVREAVVGIVEGRVVVCRHCPTFNFKLFRFIRSVGARRHTIFIEILDALNGRRQGAVFYVRPKGGGTVGRSSVPRSVEVSGKIGREFFRRVFESVQLMFRVDVFDAHLIILDAIVNATKTFSNIPKFNNLKLLMMNMTTKCNDRIMMTSRIKFKEGLHFNELK